MSKNIYRLTKVRKFVESLNQIFNVETKLTNKYLSSYLKNNNGKVLSYTDSFMGENNPFYGKKHTKETKEFLSKKQTGVPIHSEKWKKELSRRMKLNNIGGSGKNNPFYGKKHSEETLKIIREKRAKQIISLEIRKKMSETHKKRWAKIKREDNLCQKKQIINI